MVSTRLYGRRGNQLFQAAHCIAFAKKYDLEYHIPASTQNNSIWPPALTHLENKKLHFSEDYVFVKEKEHSFQGFEFKEEWKEKHILFEGYWQNFGYFDWCIEDIRKAFGFTPKEAPKNTASIHVRRGDYLLYKDKHPVVTEEYIRSAIDQIWEKTNSIWKFRFFSDDIPWCMEFAEKYFPFHHNCSFSSGTESEDFEELLGYQHSIISNSSFSLMAAILKPKAGIVVSPSVDNWFGSGNASLSTKDMIPAEWIQIKY